jgi:selenide,water dikinase
MSGLVREFDLAGARLVGGHSMEGEELAVGVTVNGAADSVLISKHGARPGDLLVLSKPLGVGVIFAASRNGVAPGDVTAVALDSMLRSNRDAAELGRALGASACTDVTGFGLLGHLLEMLSGGGLAVTLANKQLPCLAGARELVESGVRSTLYAGNLGSLPPELAALAEQEPLLCDPQTSGGLLMAISPDRADRLVEALAERGHEAAVIGELRASHGDSRVYFR